MIVFVSALLFFNKVALSQNQINLNDIIGKWRYAKHFDWRASKFGNKEIQSLRTDTLVISKNKIYFRNLKMIKPCTFSKINIRNFFDRDDKEPNVIEDRALALKYTKEQLSAFKRIETNCEQDNCLGVLYFKQDTLILNYCEGITIFMTKVSRGRFNEARVSDPR